MLQTTIVLVMGKYHNKHNFMHLTWLWHDEFYKFAFGDRSEYCLYFFDFQYYKDSTIFASHQIYKNLQFVQLTLKTNIKYFQFSLFA